MDRLAHLNEAQRTAVQTLQGPLLILAGAGTGKTRVITHRMAELIRSGVAADRILSVTFTNKAAREMLERTRTLLKESGLEKAGARAKRPWISTFHSLCVDILRQEITALDYPSNFGIVDASDQEAVVRNALKEVRVTEKQLRPAEALSQISRWKCAGLAPEQAADVASGDQEFLAAVAYRKYQARLRAIGGVDFDDLLLLTDRLFQDFPAVLERQQQRFQSVQIDEYQDTNDLQFRLVEALVREHHNLCVVGDDDQSIYSWRGAEVRHILQFSQRFPEAQAIRLEENYRCVGAILDLANRLVAHNRGRHPKVLRATRDKGAAVRFQEYPDEQLEAEMVVREIKFLIEQKNVSPREIAILFRTNEQPRLFEAELRRVSVRYVLVGSQSFYDRKETRDLLAYLKLLSRPQDEQSLLRIINVPPRGIGDSTVEKVVQRGVKAGLKFWDAVNSAEEDGTVTVKAATTMRQFRDLIEAFRPKFRQDPRKMEDHLRELLSQIHYDTEIERIAKDPLQQQVKQAAVAEFVQSLQEYLQRADKPTLADFLTGVVLEGRDEEPDKDAQVARDAVKLLTLHSAKGLEFPRVYLVGMEEGLLPHKRSVADELQTMTTTSIEEERRLAYVGLTRAQDHLTLTRAATRKKWGKVKPSTPSRFLSEMRAPEKTRNPS